MLFLTLCPSFRGAMPISGSMPAISRNKSQVTPDPESHEYSTNSAANQFTEYSSVSLPSSKPSVHEEGATVQEHDQSKTFNTPKCEQQASSPPNPTSLNPAGMSWPLGLGQCLRDSCLPS